MTIQETQQLAEQAALDVQKYRVLALVGELGAGKTAFTQFFLRALGVQGPIASPTFVIIKKYVLPHTSHAKPYIFAYHIDCYRLKDPRELLTLGFKEILENSNNIVIIEWADRVKDLIPAGAAWLYFDHGITKDERIIKISSI